MAQTHRFARDVRAQAGDRVKVSFLGVGAQKAGTLGLDTYLRTHPGLCMAKVKEVHLFDDGKTFFKRSIGGYAEYHRQFAPTSTAQLLGEVTPAYMYWNDAPRRIWEYNSAMKLIRRKALVCVRSCPIRTEILRT